MSEIVKTRGIVLDIRPWSRTSHVVTWITNTRGILSTHVKGAVRPKSAFLGQYDLNYTCEVLYYTHASAGGLHALREVTPLNRRDHLRTNWRAAVMAGYARGLVRELAPAGEDDARWYDFLSRYLDQPGSIVALEMEVLKLAGVAPDFSAVDCAQAIVNFAVDAGRTGEGQRVLRVTPETIRALETGRATPEAIRFLGTFLAYHLDLPPEMRRIALMDDRG